MDERAVRRILSRLLRLYPASFRHRLGDDLLETMVQRWRDGTLVAAGGRLGPASGGDRAGALRFWVRDGLRFAVDGVLERLRVIPATFADVREGWRQVVRTPRGHVVPVLTLAVGIAATTTILTVTDAVVFRPLPYPAAGELYLIHSRFGPIGTSSNSLLNLGDLQSSARTMAWIAGAEDRSPALTAAGGEPERVSSLLVTQDYLTGLGARVRVGRGFVADDFAAGAARVAIVSDGLWQRRLGGRASAIGSSIELDGVEHVVIGVMDAGFRDPGPIESGAITSVWTAVRDGDRRHRDDYGFRLLGRLAPGTAVETVQRELTALGARLSAAYPETNRFDGHDLDFVLVALHDETVGSAGSRLLLLLGAVGLLLVLSCVNAANLFFARGVTRASELAVRCALGATRGRLTTQLLAESLLTAVIAGVIGGALGIVGVRLFEATAPAGIPRLHEVTLDWRVFALMAGLTGLTAVLFGSLPALRASRRVAATTPRVTTDRGGQRVQSALVAAEIALALVLVTGSALLLGSVRNLLRVEPGFDGSDVTVVDVRPPVWADTHARTLEFYAALVERARALPGVASAGALYTAPGLTGGFWSHVTPESGVPASGQAPARAPAMGEHPGEEMYRLNPLHGDVFATLDIPLRAGRAFDGRAGDDDAYVVVLNESAARRFFPGVENPVGRRLKLGSPDTDAPLREIVGVVQDVRQLGAEHDAEPQVYLPYGQRDADRLSLVVETRTGAPLSHDAVRRLVRDVDPAVPIDRIESLAARYAVTGEQTLLLTFLVSVFAGIGLLLAVVGTYATTTHALARRVRELCIRVALGARPAAIVRLVLARGLAIAAAGIAAGVLLSLVLTHFLDGYVYGVTARDPLTLALAALVIGACSLLACLGPVLRAARVDPNDVLRGE